MPKRTSKSKTKNQKPTTGLAGRKPFSKRGLFVLVSLAAIVGGAFVYQSFAASVQTVQAEATYTSVNSFNCINQSKPCWKVVADPLASNQQTVMLFANGSIAAQYNTNIITKPPVAFRIWAKADPCYNPRDGSLWPIMELSQPSVTGSQVLHETREVRSATKYSAYSTYAKFPTSGILPIIRFKNDFVGSGCDRNLYIDKVDVIY